MNDEERRQWVLNNEPLYLAYRRSRIGLYEYIKTHRDEIDRYLREVMHVSTVWMGKGKMPRGRK